MWEEIGDGEERHTDAESDDHVDGPEAIFFEHPNGLAERVFRVDNGGGVGGHAMVCDSLLFFSEEVSLRGGFWKDYDSNDTSSDSECSFESISMVLARVGRVC